MECAPTHEVSCLSVIHSTLFYFLRSEGRAAAHEKVGLNALLNARLPSFFKNFVTLSPCFLYNSTQTNKDVKN